MLSVMRLCKYVSKFRSKNRNEMYKHDVKMRRLDGNGWWWGFQKFQMWETQNQKEEVSC